MAIKILPDEFARDADRVAVIVAAVFGPPGFFTGTWKIPRFATYTGLVAGSLAVDQPKYSLADGRDN